MMLKTIVKGCESTREINIKINRDGYTINIKGREFKNTRISKGRIEQKYSDKEMYEFLNDNDLADALLNDFTFFDISNAINNTFKEK